jgi:hypothetical protein
MVGESIFTDKKDTYNFVEDPKLGGVLELFKSVHVTNTFITHLELQKIHLPTEYLMVRAYTKSIKLPISVKEKVFEMNMRLPISGINKTHFNTWMGLESNHMIVPIHVNAYDKRLYCSMDIDGQEVIEKCFGSNNTSLDFGFIGVNEVKYENSIATTDNV